MQMAGDLALRAGRFVTKDKAVEGEHGNEAAADAGPRSGVVIAEDPHPLASALEARERRAIVLAHAVGALAVMEAVAEGDDRARRVAGDDSLHPRERRGGIIGRQQHAACGKARAFLQMQIGEDKHALLGPIERALAIGHEPGARNRDL